MDFRGRSPSGDLMAYGTRREVPLFDAAATAKVRTRDLPAILRYTGYAPGGASVQIGSSQIHVLRNVGWQTRRKVYG